MRDSFFDKNYFDSYIQNEIEGRRIRKNKLKNNEIKEERVFIVKSFIYRDIMQSLIAKYSAGYPIEDLYEDYYEAVHYMYESWMVLDNRAYLKDIKYNHYFGSDYDLMLWMLSIGYLLDVENDSFLKLIEILDRFEVRDLLYETIIKTKIPSRPQITEESYKMIMDIPWVYEKLRKAIYCTDDEWGKIDATEYIRLFLTEDFYPRHKGFSFYDHHKSKNNIYYGYWSFESAAIAKSLHINVNNFENSKYFPKDMYYFLGNEPNFGVTKK